MTISIFSNGKEYISASRASEKIDYSSDYIGQLCRSGKIPSKLIGRTWYVDFEALVEHKKFRQLGKPRKGSFSYMPVERSGLPQLSKRVLIVPPVLTRKLVREFSAASFALLAILTGAFTVLELSSPPVARSIEQNVEAGSESISQLASVSLGSFTGIISDSFSFLKNLFGDDEPELTVLPAHHPPEEDRTASAKGSGVPSLGNWDWFKDDLKSELYSYVDQRLATDDRLPTVYLSGSPDPADIVYNYTYNPTILREEILLADTRPAISIQSDRDSSRVSNSISNILNGGDFTGATITDSTGAFSTLSGATFSFTNATGTTLYLSGDARVDGDFTVGGDTITVGQLVSTRIPTLAHVFAPSWPSGTSNASDATIYINPASAAPDTNIFAAAVGGAVKFLVDAEGDVYANNLVLTGSTSQGATTIAGNLTVQDSSTLGDASSDLTTINGQLLALASTTLQNFTFLNATGTSATTTNFFSTTASTTNLFSSVASIGGSAFNVTSAGNVGIGVTNPGALLTIGDTQDNYTNTLAAIGGSSYANPTLKISSVSNTSNSGPHLQLMEDFVDLYGTDIWYDSLDNITKFDAYSAGSGVTAFVYNSTGQIGMGTLGPAVKLDVTGSVAASTVGTEDIFHITRLTNPGVSWPQLAAFKLGTYDSTGVAPATRLDISLKSASDETLTGDTTVMTLQSNGNVGIWTTNPTKKLDVRDGALNLSNVDTTALGYPDKVGHITMFNASDEVRIDFGQGVSNYGVMAWRRNATPANATFDLVTGSHNNDIRIDAKNVLLQSQSTGNVGIGTTVPGAKLDILKTWDTTPAIRLGDVTTDATQKLGRMSLRHYTNAEEDITMFFADANGTDNIIKYGGGTAFGNAATKLTFWTAANTITTTGTERMRIGPTGGLSLGSTYVDTDPGSGSMIISGNVGIGTTNPGSKLQIDGGHLTFGTDNAYDIGASSATRPRTGYFGTSVITPLLETVNLLATSSTTLQNFTFLNATGTSATTTSFFATTASSTNLFSSLLSVGGSALNVISGGNVGIGTTTPTGKLHVVGTGSGASLATSGSVDGTINARVGRSLATIDFGILDDGAGYIQSRNQSNLATNYNLLLSPNGGNVGIGTTNPDRLLTLKGASAGTSVLSIHRANTSDTQFNIKTSFHTVNDTDFKIEFDSGNANMHFRSTLAGGTGGKFVFNDGNVGIGTTNPSSRLDVLAGASGNFVANFFNDGNNSNYFGIGIQVGTDDNSGTNYHIHFRDGDSTDVGYVTSSGGTVSYGAFTANHDVSLPEYDNASGYPYGTLVCSTMVYVNSDSLRGVKYDVKRCDGSTYNSAVLGAYAGKYDDKANLHQVYILGDGHILVNGENGDIKVGDPIVTSSTAGIGMRGTDVGIAIGIAQENYVFSSASESKLIAVQYGLSEVSPVRLAEEEGFDLSITKYFERIWGAVVTKLADAANGIAKLFAKEVYTEKLCVKKSDGSDVCVTGDELAALLVNAGQTTTSTSSSEPATSEPTTDDLQPTSDISTTTGSTTTTTESTTSSTASGPTTTDQQPTTETIPIETTADTTTSESTASEPTTNDSQPTTDSTATDTAATEPEPVPEPTPGPTPTPTETTTTSDTTQ